MTIVHQAGSVVLPWGTSLVASTWSGRLAAEVLVQNLLDVVKVVHPFVVDPKNNARVVQAARHTFEWCGIPLDVNPKLGEREQIVAFLLELKDATGKASLYDIVVNRISGRTSRFASFVDNSDTRIVYDNGIATLLAGLRSTATLINTMTLSMNGVLSSSPLGTKVTLSVEAQGTLSDGQYPRPTSRILAKYTFSDGRPDVLIQMMVVHASHRIQKDVVYIIGGLDFSKDKTIASVKKYVVDPAIFSSFIDVISTKWTIHSSEFEKPPSNDGALALKVSSKIDNSVVSLDILLSPTRHDKSRLSTFPGAIIFRNLLLTDLNVKIPVLLGGEGHLRSIIVPGMEGTQDLHRLLFCYDASRVEDPTAIIHVHATLTTVINAIHAKGWESSGWQLTGMAGSDGCSRYSNQGDGRSVPLQFWFLHQATGKGVTLHVVARSDGSLRVNWQEKISRYMGPTLYNIPGDKTSGEKLPQWWNPAVIEKPDGTERYKVDPDVPGKTTMLEVFLADIPFDMPMNPPVVT